MSNEANKFLTGVNTAADDGINGYYWARKEGKSKEEAWEKAVEQMRASFQSSDFLIGGQDENNPSTGRPQNVASSACVKIDKLFDK